MRIVIKGLLLEYLGVTQSRNVVVITYNLKNKLCQTVLWFQFSSNKKRNDLDQISCACNLEKLESTIAFIDHFENMLHLTELHSVCSYCPVRHTLKN